MTAERIDGLVAGLARLLAWIAGGLVLAIALIVAGDVLARNLIGRTLFQAFEIGTYLFAAAIAFGFAHTLVVGGNIRLDVLHARFARPVRRALDLAALASIAAVSVLFARMAWHLTSVSAARGVTSSTGLAVPLALPQAVWAAGLTVLAATALWMTARHAVLSLRGDAARADALGGMWHEDGAR